MAAAGKGGALIKTYWYQHRDVTLYHPSFPGGFRMFTESTTQPFANAELEKLVADGILRHTADGYEITEAGEEYYKPLREKHERESEAASAYERQHPQADESVGCW